MFLRRRRPEPTPNGGLDFYDYDARAFDPTLMRFTSRDPLAVKYFSVSPYAYCANNPVLYVDPDGREKLIFFNKEKDKDKTLIAGAEKYKDDGAIHIFAHGNSKGIYPIVNGKKMRITSAKNFEKFLNKHSEIWKNREEGEDVTIILHSCRTANESDGKENSFARNVSKELGKGVTIVGANTYLWVGADGKSSVNDSPSRDSNGVPILDENGNPKPDIKGKLGNWYIFDNGVIGTKYDGRYQPKDIPTLWDKIRYEQIEKK